VLKQRLLTALVLIPALLFILLVMPRHTAVVVLALMVLQGAWEWSGFLRIEQNSVRVGYVAAIALLMATAWFAALDSGVLNLLLAAALLWWLVAFLWLSVLPGKVSYHYQGTERYGMIILLALIFTGVIGWVLNPLYRGMYIQTMNLIGLA